MYISLNKSIPDTQSPLSKKPHPHKHLGWYISKQLHFRLKEEKYLSEDWEAIMLLCVQFQYCKVMQYSKSNSFQQKIWASIRTDEPASSLHRASANRRLTSRYSRACFSECSNFKILKSLYFILNQKIWLCLERCYIRSRLEVLDSKEFTCGYILFTCFQMGLLVREILILPNPSLTGLHVYFY